MSSTSEVGASAPKRVRARRLAAGVLAAAAVSVASPLVGRASALPSCGGNQKIEVAPFSCEKERTIDGTTFSVVIEVSNRVVTVTYTLDAPRNVETPIRVRSHKGISSQPNVSEADTVIPAGGTTATLTVSLLCGQIDVKAVFTGNGDSRGRIVAPYVTDTNDCASSVTSTTASTTTATTAVTTTTSPTTSPTSGQTGSSVSGSSAATTAPSGTGSLPVTGSGAALALVGGGLVMAGLVLATAGRARRTVDGTG